VARRKWTPHNKIAEVIRPDPVALLVEQRPPGFVSFDDTGYDNNREFLVARALAVGFLRRGYRGWLSINNGRGREYADQTPAMVDLHLNSWSLLVDVSAPRRTVPPAVVLSWDPRHGGDLTQLDPIHAICHQALQEWTGAALARLLMTDLDDCDGDSPGRPATITREVLRGLRAIACALTAPQAEHPDVRTACEWLRTIDPKGCSLFEREKACEIIQEEVGHVLLGDPFISDPRVDYAGIAQEVARRAMRRMPLGVRALDRNQLRQAAKETRDEYVRNQWLNADRILNAIVNRVLDEIEGEIEDEERALDKTKRSPTWWDEHTVVRLAITHLNEHGARVLFSMPYRGIDLIAETPEQAERQLAYARERWPEGIYKIQKVRFWRDVDGRPGNPVHTLVDDPPPPESRAE